MTAVEFVNFFAMFIISLIVLRTAQIAARNTWVGPALGALNS